MRALFVIPLLLCANVARAAPPEGEPTHVRRGVFTDVDLGLFSTLGGAQGYSSAQSYLQWGVGYDFRRLELRLSFGMGTSAADCFAHSDPATGACELSEDFSLGFFELSGAYRHPLAKRLFLTPRVAMGYVRMDPSPMRSPRGRPMNSGFDLGAGVGLDYATSLDHFSVGVALMARFVIGPNIPAIALFPRLKYTF